MKFILAKKEKMSQIFDETGSVVPVTLVAAGPVTITGLKSKEKDGYEATRFGFDKRRSPKAGQPFRFYREARGTVDGELAKGKELGVSVFEEGDKVTVSGISKGKGFQGVVKRHGFHGGPRSHGQKHSEREPGSIGATGPQKVIKGMRMAGRMGGDRITVKNLKVIKIDKEKNQMAISGAIPGRRGTLLEIRKV